MEVEIQLQRWALRTSSFKAKKYEGVFIQYSNLLKFNFDAINFGVTSFHFATPFSVNFCP